MVRGAVETTCYVLSAISLLLLLPVGEAMSAGPGTASPAGVRVRSLIVPPWIAVRGLAAIPLYVAAFVLAMYAVIGTDSAAQTLLYTPLAVQKVVLAVWMIARGFRPATVSPPRSRGSQRWPVPDRHRRRPRSPYCNAKRPDRTITDPFPDELAAVTPGDVAP